MGTWRTRLGKLMRNTEGAVAIMAAFLLVALLGVASLAIDMGQLYVVRNALQNNADAAALAAAGNLITNQNGVAVRDASAAQQAAMTVAQRQRQLAGLPAVDPGARNDLTILFGVWDLKTGDPQTAWTEIGSTCGSDSNANAIRITLRRGAGTIIGPVSTLFARIFGVNTTEVAATATAYLGSLKPAICNSVWKGTFPRRMPWRTAQRISMPIMTPLVRLPGAVRNRTWFISGSQSAMTQSKADPGRRAKAEVNDLIAGQFPEMKCDPISFGRANRVTAHPAVCAVHRRVPVAEARRCSLCGNSDT